MFIGLLRKIRDGDVELEQSRKNRKEFKSDLNEIVIGQRQHKPKEQKSITENDKMFYEAQEKVFKLFNDYSTIVSMAKYKVTHGEDLKISTPKQMFQRFPIALS